jgi:hypothetical protein
LDKAPIEGKEAKEAHSLFSKGADSTATDCTPVSAHFAVSTSFLDASLTKFNKSLCDVHVITPEHMVYLRQVRHSRLPGFVAIAPVRLKVFKELLDLACSAPVFIPSSAIKYSAACPLRERNRLFSIFLVGSAKEATAWRKSLFVSDKKTGSPGMEKAAQDCLQHFPGFSDHLRDTCSAIFQFLASLHSSDETRLEDMKD